MRGGYAGWVILGAAALAAACGPLASTLEGPRPTNPAPASTRAGGPLETAAPPADLHAASQSIVDIVNHDRTLLGLPALEPAEPLTDIAFRRSQDMLARGYLGHADPADGSLLAWSWLTAAGYSGRLGENLLEYRGDLSGLPQEVVHAWIVSRSHRELILDPRYRLTGVGLAGAGGLWRVTQVFAERGP